MIEKKQREPLLTKCLDCEKNLFYGKTCQGECTKEVID
jgi:F0F1-type ATP synthase assembly protein I